MSEFNETPKDKVFDEKIIHATDFKFDSTVANVFDDMVNRSVPFYGEMQRMIAEQAADYTRLKTNVYDLGCATGTTLIGMNTTIDPRIPFIGLDDSAKMLKKCHQKLTEAQFKRPFELKVADLNTVIDLTNASVVILCLTLQFIRPINRARLLKNIFNGLNKGGVLILTEKILAENTTPNRDFIKYYYNHKRRNNYSEMEISQKREALENILIPYKLSENITLLHETGFKHCEVFFKWYNFSGLIAVKG
jgi:tRNA (cmo5U34)-methyltransferase